MTGDRKQTASLLRADKDPDRTQRHSLPQGQPREQSTNREAARSVPTIILRRAARVFFFWHIKATSSSCIVAQRVPRLALDLPAHSQKMPLRYAGLPTQTKPYTRVAEYRHFKGASPAIVLESCKGTL